MDSGGFGGGRGRDFDYGGGGGSMSSVRLGWGRFDSEVGI